MSVADPSPAPIKRLGRNISPGSIRKAIEPAMVEQMADRDTVRLWRVYSTVHQLVSDRGYEVTQAELNLSLADFLINFAAGGSIIE